MPTSPYATATAWQSKTYTYTYRCYAPPVLFGPWEAVPLHLQDDCATHNGLPCDGGGFPGSWCLRCRYGDERLENT